MRKIQQRAWLRAIFVALILVGMIAGASPVEQASAQDAHRSWLKISSSEPLPVTRRVTLGLNKSMVVELPREVQDVHVSTPTMMDAVIHSSKRVYLIGMKTGQANAFFFDRDGKQILTLEVAIERDLKALTGLLKRFIPGARIKAEMVNDNVVLTGSVPNPAGAVRATDIAGRFVEEKDKVLNMLAVDAKEQVLLKVTIAEMNRDMIKRLGVNWNGRTRGRPNLGSATNNGFPVSNQSGVNTSLFGVVGADLASCIIPSTALGSIFPPVTLPAASGANCLSHSLEAFERNGLSRTLAEPNLTAISGETASFLAGGEFPIPVSNEDGAISVEWKPFGVGLSFTPLVMSEGRISLKISTEVSELSTEGAVTAGSISLQALKVRRAETTVELPSGGALVMAGLISDDTKQNLDGVPGLKKLPVLGSLFRSTDFQKSESELVVIVTPYTVNPTARNKLARPDDGFMPASDFGRYFMGRLNRVYGREPDAMPSGGYKGNYGYIVK
ncbi:MAG: type II and III secretion system protein family protein [Methyloligellaceae bacterium]